MKKGITFLALLIPTIAHSGPSGNDLHTWLNSVNEFEQSYAEGYIAGIIGAEDLQKFVYLELAKTHKDMMFPENKFCPPSQSTLGQGTDIVKRHLTENPSKRHFQASQQVVVALGNAWPCNQQGESS